MDNAKKIYQEYVCQVCQHTITDTGMCEFHCKHDLRMPRLRPSGTVIKRTYEMTLINEEAV